MIIDFYISKLELRSLMLKKNKINWILLDLLSVYSEGYVQTHLEIPDLKLRENQPFKTFWV